ncbi:MAG: DUF4382 domain-containing protein [Salegentibacter sp.]|uniref:Carboxypeptidase regulatory-like domain-containing protein n=1 Tax=Salegentibacter flavus TaxID=287099 RepID=A0A1I5AXG2_9FLAO|nr:MULTISPECIES: DUF4382 domain-containing protein [Salegentibacter]MDR9455864.1 DUF4382 domain-containing protein [Salegentibacter sp.]SFN67206.1 Carboxypeptidase regulatory-like domain-containing protein [Salegentibacter flavus]
MKRSFRKWSLKPAIFLAVLGLGLTSCSDDDTDDAITEENARVTVRMTDAPGDYDAVIVDVEDVMIQVEAEQGVTDEEGWLSLDDVEAGQYDLLELTGGMTQLLADSEIPAGFVSQMRLVLGPDNFVEIDGDLIPLATPSAEQSGLKLNLNQELEAGEHYEFLLDFDVEESIVETGNGGLILKPVIRLSAYADTGEIVGEVHPTEYSVLVTATNGTNTISAYTADNGAFVLHALPAGTYKVTITPEEASGYSMITINDVVVEADGTTDLETVFLDGTE